jgi:hypothetical protein
MKVAICHTKLTAKPMIEAFSLGIIKNGDLVEHVESKADIYKLKKCDISFQIAEVTRYEMFCFHSNLDEIKKEGYLKVAVKKEFNKKRMILDCGILADDRHRPLKKRYFSIGVDGVKGGAEFYNKNSPSDRFRKRNIKIKEWRTSGDHILIIGQTHYGSGLAHVGTENDSTAGLWSDPTDYYQCLVKRIREQTDRPIIFRTHPIGDKGIQNQIKPPKGIKNLTIADARQTNVHENLKNAWCAVTRTSNGAVDAVFNGIPTITEDPICLAYDVCEHDINNIENPVKPERNQWLYDMSYAEWSLKEMARGVVWQYLKKNLEGTPNE